MAAATLSSLSCSTSTIRCAVPQRRSRIMPTVRAVVTAERQSLELTKMEPLNDRILVKPYVEEAVVSIGSEVKLDLKAGDAVVFQKYAMAEVEVPEGEILFVAEKSVLGVLQK